MARVCKEEPVRDEFGGSQLGFGVRGLPPVPILGTLGSH